MSVSITSFAWRTSTAQHGKHNTNFFPQTVESMKSFNDGVFGLIQSTPELNEHMKYMDVFSASLTWPYVDHIHMDEDYLALTMA